MKMKHPNIAERWCAFELELEGPAAGNPFADVTLSAEFSCGSRTFSQPGFYDGDGRYIVRAMPDTPGDWSFVTRSSCPGLDGLEGRFTCTAARPTNHGPVRVRNTYHFAYEDGAAYYPFGTTCYAWTHQGEELERQTLKTLSEAPFNKMRMCVFPKHYDYNKNEPELYPFEGSLDAGWDFGRFNPAFFRHLETRIKDLMELGIEADLILFHPYDKWGLSTMDAATDIRYLHYIVARLAAYRNVWWSFANEYDLMKKSLADWEQYAAVVMDCDPYAHLRSIHNCFHFYDHARPWITHCSVQRVDVYKTSEQVNEWRDRYRKPVVVDECAYEGNINHGWGNITGMEMTRRFWEGTVRGGYVGHGETYYNPEEVLWWSKGGSLRGESPARIAFLRQIVEEGPEQGLSPIAYEWDIPCGGVPGEYYLFYFGFYQPSFRIFRLPEGLDLVVDVIDTWNMTVERLPGVYSGEFRIDMPGRQHIAVRMRKA